MNALLREPSCSLLQRLPLTAALEALLPCPGRREIYLREIVCEYCAYSNLCNPSELSLRTLKRYRSLCPRTRQCLQPEGIVKVYGKCYCC